MHLMRYRKKTEFFCVRDRAKKTPETGASVCYNAVERIGGNYDEHHPL